MNWVRNNRFLAGFLAIILIVGGGLTYLLISAQSHYADVSTQYDSQVEEMQRLQKLSMFPNDSNLKKYEQIQKEYQQEVVTLQASLASLEPKPAEPPPTPLQFQDRLRQVVEETIRNAQRANVGLPNDFYLGFEKYRGTPPETAATPLLNTQLTEIQNLVDLLINQHIEKMTAIKRGLLPQEGGSNAGATPTPANGRTPATPAAPLVAKYPLEISFTAVPSAFRETLNRITSDKQLYIVRALQVKNQVDKGPSKTEGVPGAAGGLGVTPGTGVAAATPSASAAAEAVDANGVPIPPLPDKGPAPLRYVVGQERLDVVARIELVSVKPPAAR